MSEFGYTTTEEDAIQEKWRMVVKALHVIDWREEAILTLRYFVGHKPISYRQIAELLHLSKDRVRQLELRSIARLRKRIVFDNGLEFMAMLGIETEHWDYDHHERTWIDTRDFDDGDKRNDEPKSFLKYETQIHL